MAARPPKPSDKLLRLAAQALPKLGKNRTAAEKRAVRLTKAWRMWKKQQQAQASQGGGAWLGQPPMTAAQMDAWAATQAQNDLAAAQAGLDTERARAEREAQAQQALIQRLTADLGGVVAPIGANMQGAYQQAAQAQGALAQGFSGAMEQTAQAEAARNAADLAKWGGSVAAGDVAQQSMGASDPLYGTGGFLPGASLAQQGASWGAYGASLPGVVARMGQQDAGNVASSYAELQRELADRAAELSAKLPQLRAQYLERVQATELARDDQRLKWASAKALAEQAGIEQNRWEAEFAAGRADAATAAELDWAQINAGAAADAANAAADRQAARDERQQARKARQKEKNAAKRKFEALLTQNAPAMEQLKWTKWDSLTNKPASGSRKRTWREVGQAIRNAFASEIADLRNLGVTDAAITLIIRRFLRQFGFPNVPNPAPANPPGRPGGYWA